MQQTKVLETWVGLFVALGLVGMFFLAMKVSNLADFQVKSDSYRIFARFQNVGSLRERAPVSMAGVRIGRVTSIRFDKETYEALVEMRIDPEYNTLPTDTTATVLTAGLLGEQYIGLTPGGAAEFLKDGDEIELTQSAMVLEEVISRFLFSKAESGSEKKESAASDSSKAEDQPEASANGRSEMSGEGALAAPRAKQEAESSHKPRAGTIGKALEKGHEAPKPKGAGRGAEGGSPRKPEASAK